MTTNQTIDGVRKLAEQACGTSLGSAEYQRFMAAMNPTLLLDLTSAAAQPQGVPAVLMELVENKIYGGMHIAKWDNPGGLKEGFHRLYTEQPAPVAEQLIERLAKRFPDLENMYTAEVFADWLRAELNTK